VPPGHVIVFDRVRSTEPAFEKRWLLHTAAEPEIDGRRFTASHEEGRVFGRTLLPEAATIEKRGGGGEQFWSDGQHWPLPDSYSQPDTHPPFGQWRIEARTDDDVCDTCFLHLLETADRRKDDPEPGELLRTESTRGVRFRSRGTEWEVRFETSGPPGGRIRTRNDDGDGVDATLTKRVEPQTGFRDATEGG